MTRVQAVAADALAIHARAIVDRTVETLYARHPEWDARWGRSGRDATARDTAFHVEFLEAAVRTDRPGVFRNYSAWLASILRTRNVPIEAAEESYALIRDAVRELTPAAASVVDAPIEAGLAALHAPAHVPGARGTPIAARDGLVDALLAPDRARTQRILADALAELGSLARVADLLIQPAMARVGELWQENRVSVAQEHLATALMQTALARAFAASERADAPRRRVLLACVEGNHHTLGLRVVADAFEAEGWDARYLGGDVPTRDLLAAVSLHQPDVLAISLSLPAHVATGRRIIERVRETSPATRVIAGGLALNEVEGLAEVIGADAWYPGAREVMVGLR